MKEIVKMDEKGRILIPKEIRDHLKKKELVIIEDRLGVRIIPKLSLNEMRGIFGIKVGTGGLRDKHDRVI